MEYKDDKYFDGEGDEISNSNELFTDADVIHKRVEIDNLAPLVQKNNQSILSC